MSMKNFLLVEHSNYIDCYEKVSGSNHCLGSICTDKTSNLDYKSL